MSDNDNVTPFNPAARAAPKRGGGDGDNDNSRTPPGKTGDYEFTYRSPEDGSIMFVNYNDVYLMPTQVGLAAVDAEGSLVGLVNYEYFIYARQVEAGEPVELEQSLEFDDEDVVEADPAA